MPDVTDPAPADDTPDALVAAGITYPDAALWMRDHDTYAPADLYRAEIRRQAECPYCGSIPAVAR